MAPYDIRARRFGRRLLRGLKPEEVTAFLDEVADALETAQRLNSEMATQLKLSQEQIRSLTTEQTPPAPSDTAEGAEPVRDLAEPNVAVGSRPDVLRSAALQEIEALLHDAQARARALTAAADETAAAIVRDAEALKSHRHQEADQLKAEATTTAESILTTARDQQTALRQEIDRLAESRLRMLDDVRATLDACHEWLATVDPRRQSCEERKASSESVTIGLFSTGER